MHRDSSNPTSSSRSTPIVRVVTNHLNQLTSYSCLESFSRFKAEPARFKAEPAHSKSEPAHFKAEPARFNNSNSNSKPEPARLKASRLQSKSFVEDSPYRDETGEQNRPSQKLNLGLRRDERSQFKSELEMDSLNFQQRMSPDSLEEEPIMGSLVESILNDSVIKMYINGHDTRKPSTSYSNTHEIIKKQKKTNQQHKNRHHNRFNQHVAFTLKHAKHSREPPLPPPPPPPPPPPQHNNHQQSTLTLISEKLSREVPPPPPPPQTHVSFKKPAATKLPQNFDCKYMGKLRCDGIWGLKYLRQSVDQLVEKTKQKRSVGELVDFEILITAKGLNVVQRVASGGADGGDNSTMAFSENCGSRSTFKSGLLPSEKISYAAQDPVYKKIFSCILVREKSGETISECYSFLCPNADSAKRMALALTQVFKELAESNRHEYQSERVYNDELNDDYSFV